MRKFTLRLVLCQKKLVIFLVTVLISIIIFFTPAIRNCVLYPVWPLAWRQLSTFDMLQIRFFSMYTLGVEPVTSCPATVKSKVKLSDVDISKVKIYMDIDNNSLRSPEHQKYLTTITMDDKVKLLYTYMVLADALKNMRVEFFFVQGSLLGVHRHQGLIPWDDDLDIVVNVSDWKLVRHGLSCIEGFGLSVTNFMIWKFYLNNSNSVSHYPFVDIFFYNENNNAIWAVSKSTSSFLVFRKEETFPLTTGQYEGLSVPVPKNTDQLLRVLYNYDICQSRGMNHKTHEVVSLSEVSRVPCSSLTYLYTMYHLKST